MTDDARSNATRGLFDNPLGGSDSFNWQGALIWRYSDDSRLHASVSDRSRFPVIFELYSTRFGTATLAFLNSLTDEAVLRDVRFGNPWPGARQSPR